MDKIYRRATQLSDTPKKKKNEKNRVRNIIMNFRVSPQEKELIDARIALSGLPRAEYFISSCLYQSILVKGTDFKSEFGERKENFDGERISLKERLGVCQQEAGKREEERKLYEQTHTRTRGRSR